MQAKITCACAQGWVIMYAWAQFIFGFGIGGAVSTVLHTMQPYLHCLWHVLWFCLPPQQ